MVWMVAQWALGRLAWATVVLLYDALVVAVCLGIALMFAYALVGGVP